MKNFSISLFVIILINNPFSYCQTVNLGGIEISIGDSLNKVISKIDTNYYKLSLLKEEKMKQLGLLYDKSKMNYGNPLIGVLTFFVYPFDSTLTPQDKIIDKYLNIDDEYHQPILISIRKFWSDETSNIIDVMGNFYDILEKYGVDKYDMDVSFEKEIEPDGNSYSIYIKTSSWHEIEFFNYKNSFQLSEIFTEDNYRFYDEIYYLIFYDYNHFINKNDDYILEKFEKEEDAERRYRELSIYYLGRLLEPKSEIIRFWKN